MIIKRKVKKYKIFNKVGKKFKFHKSKKLKKHSKINN